MNEIISEIASLSCFALLKPKEVFSSKYLQILYRASVFDQAAKKKNASYTESDLKSTTYIHTYTHEVNSYKDFADLQKHLQFNRK